MGDSPSVGYLLHGTPDDPSQPGWGGQFVRIWDGRKTIFDRLTTAADAVEAFGVVEFALPVPAGMTERTVRADDLRRSNPCGRRRATGGVLRFRFSPRDAKVWPYVIRSDYPGLDGQSGSVHRRPAAARANRSRVGRASQLVDRRPRPRGRRGRASGCEEREPVARGRSCVTSPRAWPGAKRHPRGRRGSTIRGQILYFNMSRTLKSRSDPQRAS